MQVVVGFETCSDMRDVLKRDFFDRRVLEVAPQLLGKYLVQRYKGRERAYRIIEVEAYDGEADKACHASRGKTNRTKVMFGPAGHWYVYLIYGMHEMLNIVTGPGITPSAVLLRRVEFAGRRISGPGRITKQLHVTRTLNAQPADTSAGLWIEDRGEHIARKNITRTPRIGVDYAGTWKDKPYRFVLREE
jgi:DNA-3-methyladenine glycosylase